MSGDCGVCGIYTTGSVCSPCLASEIDVAEVATSTPIEPLRPLEPAQSLPLLSESGSKNGSKYGSMGVGDGSMGVEVPAPPDGSMGVDETAARAKALGIAVALGEQFDCILPRHQQHGARLHPTNRKYWRYRCETGEFDLGLAEVRAALAYGAVRRISDVEASRWKERLDHEAGLRDPRPVSMLTPKLSATATGIASGLRLYLGLRDEERWGDQPFTWARQFVMAYCSASDQQARDACEELERQKVIVRTGEKVRYQPIVWRLGGAGTGEVAQ